MVLGAGVLHATWNAVMKAVDDRLVVFAWTGVTIAICGGAALAVTGLPAAAALWFVIASAVIHVVYDLALMNAYRLGSFNQMYPVARGTAPLLVALGAGLFASEHLSPLSLSGVVLLAAGLMSLAAPAGRFRREELRALGAAVATGVAIAAYSLVDGLGVRRAGDPAAYAALLFLLEGPFFVVVAALRRSRAQWTASGSSLKGTVVGVLVVLAYGAVLWAQSRAPLAEVSALRETGVISAAVIGALFFKEGFGARRVAAAVVVATGIVLIGL